MTRWLEQKVQCDACDKVISIVDKEAKGIVLPLPWPWREVEIDGYVGAFTICCDACEIVFRNSKLKGSAPPPFIIESIRPARPDPTQPTPPPVMYTPDDDK